MCRVMGVLGIGCGILFNSMDDVGSDMLDKSEVCSNGTGRPLDVVRWSAGFVDGAARAISTRAHQAKAHAILRCICGLSTTWPGSAYAFIDLRSVIMVIWTKKQWEANGSMRQATLGDGDKRLSAYRGIGPPRNTCNKCKH